jgi:competence transcription factor ComK
MNNNKWLSEDLIKEVKVIFEPKYKTKLTNKEAIKIALSLCDVVELISKNENEKICQSITKRN